MRSVAGGGILVIPVVPATWIVVLEVIAVVMLNFVPPTVSVASRLRV